MEFIVICDTGYFLADFEGNREELDEVLSAWVADQRENLRADSELYRNIVRSILEIDVSAQTLEEELNFIIGVYGENYADNPEFKEKLEMVREIFSNARTKQVPVEEWAEKIGAKNLRLVEVAVDYQSYL